MGTIIDGLVERGVAYIPAEGLVHEAARVLERAQKVLSELSACPPLEKWTMFPELLPIAPGPRRRVVQCFLTREQLLTDPEPAEVTEVREEMRHLCREVSEWALCVLSELAYRCGLSDAMRRDLLNAREWVLNAVHYPFEGEAGRLLFPAHRDWGTLAIYPFILGDGLEMNLDGEWTPVEVPPGHMLCYAGDILGRVTGGVVKPLLYRVRQPVDGPGSRTALIFYADTVRNLVLPDGRVVHDIIDAKLRKIGQI